MPPTNRDPRIDPKSGDVLRIRNKTRTVESVGPDVHGSPRVCYEQITVKRISSKLRTFQNGVLFSEVIHAAD